MCNLRGQALPVVTNGAMTAVVADPQTGLEAGRFAEPQITPVLMFLAAPGAIDRIRLLIGSASFPPDLDCTVPPGHGHQVPLDLERRRS